MNIFWPEFVQAKYHQIQVKIDKIRYFAWGKLDIAKKIIEEIPEPKKPEVVEFKIHEIECIDCGCTFIPEKCTIALKGKFGFNIMVLVVFLKYILRGVLRKIVHFLKVAYGWRITPASVGAILERVARSSGSGI